MTKDNWVELELHLSVSNIATQSGLILTTYCMRCLHAVPFLRNKIISSILKIPKTHAVQGVTHSKCPQFGKMRGKNPYLCPLTRLSYPFFGYTTCMPLFSRISPASEYIVKANRKHKSKPGLAQTELSWISQTVAGII